MQVMHMDGGNGKENVASRGGDSVTDEGALVEPIRRNLGPRPRLMIGLNLLRLFRGRGGWKKMWRWKQEEERRGSWMWWRKWSEI